MVHELKIAPKYLYDILSGVKTWELRFNDRGYHVGDILSLREYDINSSGDPYGPIDNVEFEVTYIFDDTGYLRDGYVIMSIVPKDRMLCARLFAEWDILHKFKDEVTNNG